MKKRMLALLAIILTLSMTGCGLFSASAGTAYIETEFGPVSSLEIRDNLDMVEKRLGGLDGATAVKFESLKMGTGQGRLPDPSDYIVQGYITLTDEAAAKYASSYEWQEATPEFKLVDLEKRDIDGAWSHSADFNKDIFTNCYSGEAWISGNTIFFRFYA